MKKVPEELADRHIVFRASKVWLPWQSKDDVIAELNAAIDIKMEAFPDELAFVDHHAGYWEHEDTGERIMEVLRLTMMTDPTVPSIFA